MELRFIAPKLRLLDTVGSELLACSVFADQRPLRGVAGLVDWRMAARISRHLDANELSGASGEVVLIPGKPRIPFEKLLLLGLGSASSFDEQTYQDAIRGMLETLSGLKVRIAIVERPGRHLHKIDVLRGVDLILEACAEYEDQDVWTLVEDPADHSRIAQHLSEERRRKRLR